MHTALCSFDDRATAEQVVERLVQSGFDRRDVHLEHRHVTSEGRAGANEVWDGLGREVAVGRGILQSYGAFFASLLGEDDGGQVENYTDQVERGGFVVVVDGHDEGEALQAQALMRDLRGGDPRVVQRHAGRPRLRDLLAGRAPAAAGLQSAAGDDAGVPATRTLENDRALASGNLSEQHTLGVRHDPDLMHAPGLRYADKDKPESE